jgi:hypothetical protein
MRYTNAREMLAERFHMQRDLFSALNPNVPLDKAGGTLVVAAVPPLGETLGATGAPSTLPSPSGGTAATTSVPPALSRGTFGLRAENLGEGKVEGAPVAPKVTRIEVDKRTKRVRAFAEDGKLTADYPASIGSSEKPAPDGSAKVKAVAFDPSGSGVP